MMSDLAEIAAAAGIAIIDTAFEDGGDGKERGENENKDVSEPLSDKSAIPKHVQEWDAIFADRYTMADTEYANVVETAETSNQPPCVDNFNCRRQRDDSRNWNRDRRNDGDHGRYNNRGNYHNNWNRHGDGRPQHELQNYGDHHHRGFGDHRSMGNNDRHNWGNDSYQNRAPGYHQNRGNQQRRDDSGDHQRYRSRGEARERSPQ